MRARITILAVLCILFSTSALWAMEKGSGGSIPIISSAKLPIYPANARIANINGTVKMKVSTDGGSVAKVISLEGPPMLVNAAKEMISEWKFLQHDPTEFTVTIQYLLATTPTRASDVVVFDLGKKIVIKGFRTKS
ncbi:MAG: energy transducer TonB [Geothrix sp.]|nr:energy transducer TonB [Geothrix sp.]